MIEFLINPHKGKPVQLSREISGLLENNCPVEYHQTIRGYSPSPLLSLQNLAERLSLSALHVKDESERFGLNAFKGLGASFAVYRYLQENPGDYVFCTATDGNHGRALAWACSHFGQLARIFVPEYTTAQRIKSIRREGAVVFKVKGGYDAAVACAKNESIKNGWVLIQDTSWENYCKIPSWVVAGYTTLCFEVEEQLSSVVKDAVLPYYDIIMLQCGVGSWASSVIWYYRKKYGEKSPKFVIVEPSGSNGALSSLLNDRPSSPSGSGETIMAGLNCGIPSLISWPVLRNYADCFMLIDDDDARAAMRIFYYPEGEDRRIVSGESGAAGLGGLLKLLREPAASLVKRKLEINSDTKVLLINTEGDTDKRSFRKIVKRKS